MKLSVTGAGYVGLTTAACLAKIGQFDVHLDGRAMMRRQPLWPQILYNFPATTSILPSPPCGNVMIDKWLQRSDWPALRPSYCQ